MIRVLICEDAPGFALLARSWVDEDPRLTVVGVVGTAAEALASAQRLLPDVVLLDRTLPDTADVADLVGGLRAATPAGAVVLMSSMPGAVLADEAQRAGAQASVPKTAQAHELREVICEAGTGVQDLSRPD